MSLFVFFFIFPIAFASTLSCSQCVKSFWKRGSTSGNDVELREIKYFEKWMGTKEGCVVPRKNDNCSFASETYTIFLSLGEGSPLGRSRNRFFLSCPPPPPGPFCASKLGKPGDPLVKEVISLRAASKYSGTNMITVTPHESQKNLYERARIQANRHRLGDNLWVNLHQLTVQPPNISIGHTKLKTVNQFTYLGCTISSDARIDNEIDNRLAKANSAFGRLHKRVWKNNQLKNLTKISVYRAVVISTLMFGSESRVLYRHHLRLLERFHQCCLRSILNIHWSDFISNIEVLEMAEADSIESMLLKIQLRWVGHVSRMEDHRLPKIVLYGELSTGHRDRDAPKKRYKDCLKKSLGACHIDHRQWADIASNRASWRLTVRRTATSFEEDRRAHLTDKRQRRKNPTPNPNQPIFPCNRCNCVCLSRIGLVSHKRACS
ncbi:uncharacterized protein [Narcine bancroftii]|uniref:uncharacterized protein n=1 Tax=Narcine bancroftii TaxID=1343680 RepID=UPI00383166A5